MYTIRCFFVMVVVPILIVEVFGRYDQEFGRYDKSVSLREFQKAYGINDFNSTFGYYAGNRNVVPHDVAKFKINGRFRKRSVVSTLLIIFTNKTKPFWFTSVSVVVENYLAGSPLKLSTLNPDGSITVKYLGDKFDPRCKHLNCQNEAIVPRHSFQKRELVDPTDWSCYQGVLIPSVEGFEEAFRLISDEHLQCKLNTY